MEGMKRLVKEDKSEEEAIQVLSNCHYTSVMVNEKQEVDVEKVIGKPYFHVIILTFLC